MKLSTKGKYGLKAIFELSLHVDEGPIPVNMIASKQNIPEQYLEQIFSTLKKSKLVKSVRGAQGGYQLVKNADQYTVVMILRLTEGSLAPVECLAENALPCERSGKCATVEVYQRIYKAVNDVIDHFTLQDLLDIEKEKAANDYVI